MRISGEEVQKKAEAQQNRQIKQNWFKINVIKQTYLHEYRSTKMF